MIARFSPVMRAVAAFAADGGLVLGICNGFQVLAEAGLLPGALLRNRGLRFVAREVAHRRRAARHAVHAARSPRARPLRMPVAHGEGCYFADEATLDELERDGQVLFRYVDADGRPAGGRRTRRTRTARSGRSPASSNAAGNVAGLMPHPETAVEAVLGSDDGLGIIRSLVESAAERRGADRTRRDGERAMSALAAAAAARGAAPPAARPDRRRARRDRRPARPRAERPRAGDVQRDVERALLVQELASRCSGRCRPGARASWPGRARTPASSRSATGWRSRSRSSRTTIRAPSSRTRAPRPASAGSSATSSRWARGRSPSSTRCASATRPTRGRGTSSTASSVGSAAMATASASRRSAASSCSTGRTRATRWST